MFEFCTDDGTQPLSFEPAMSQCQEVVCRYWIFIPHAYLVNELPVLVLPEQRGTHAGEGICLENMQSLLEGVVDHDPAVTSDDVHSASTMTVRRAKGLK